MTQERKPLSGRSRGFIWRFAGVGIVSACLASNCSLSAIANHLWASGSKRATGQSDTRLPRVYKEWEITGPPEIREVDPKARYFTPWKVLPHVELMRMEEPAPELQPHLAGPPAIDELKTVLGDAIPPTVRHILRGAGTLLADAGRFAATRGDYKTLPESLAQEVHQVQPLVGGLDLLVRVE